MSGMGGCLFVCVGGGGLKDWRASKKNLDRLKNNGEGLL